MDVKLFDSELKVMEVLWEQGTKTAKEIVDVLSEADAARFARMIEETK